MLSMYITAVGLVSLLIFYVPCVGISAVASSAVSDETFSSLAPLKQASYGSGTKTGVWQSKVPET